ncbi:GFA family protein [Acuticoccus yangtzensis]|uniref:GFA family protein n=1 Tax=Acuticoccus yangtzensis TaxID=1443441 RepID=UPI000949AB6F|nr:GFA family protein [Acuticoccus yangtzensis]
MARTGRCLCGGIEVTAELKAEDMGACHCTMCRKWSGGPFMEVETGALTFTKGEPTVYASSEWAERLFCPTCGTHICYRTKDGAFHATNAALFDEAPTGTLAMEVFIDQKPDSYAFAGERKTMTAAEVMAAFAGNG